MKKNVVININDTNDTKSKIVYDNVVANMEKINLNKSEQIEYLKTRIAMLEQAQKKKYDFIILCLICFFSLIIGICLLILNFYTIGSIVVFASTIYAIIKTHSLTNNEKNFSLDKYEEIEYIRKIISDKLK